ncbi:MAG: outer membrane beta-barrel protein [Flavobacteriales bacterium]|nr:outer membrane beta-barrel protein [Flavobacteriales bacterium]
MKSLFIRPLVIGIGMLTSVLSYAQTEAGGLSSQINSQTISQQGVHALNLGDLFGLRLDGVSADGDKLGNNTWFGFMSHYGYNIVDNVQVRGYLGYDVDSFTPDQGSGSQSSSSFNAGIGASYILPIGSQNLFIGGNFGGGTLNSEDDIGGSTFSSESDYTEYSLGVKMPYLLNDGHAFTLYVNYSGLTQNFDDGDNTFTGVNLGFNTYNFNTGDRFDVFHSGQGSSFSENQFLAGNYAVGGSTGLNLTFGTDVLTQEFDGENFESETAVTQIDFNYEGLYYVGDGFGIRGGFDYSLAKFCDPESDASSTASLLMVMIGAQYHIDAVCPAFYGFLDVGAGSSAFTITNDDDEEVSSDSEGLFGLNLGVGDQYFIAPRLALRPEIGFRFLSRGDVPVTESGLNFNLGFIAYVTSD